MMDGRREGRRKKGARRRDGDGEMGEESEITKNCVSR